MAKTKRSNFSEVQKARIFVRDRATCSFSGENLWILDYGADPNFAVDWVDHVIPCAHGGLATLENGVCAHWFLNHKKSAKSEESQYLFRNGRPTKRYFRLNDTLDSEIASNLKRFGKLHYSDWFLNRAFCRLLWGVAFLDGRGETVKRDDQYYAKGSFKAVSRWKSIIQKENVATLEKRGLVGASLSTDQELMLTIREANCQADIRALMDQLLPFFTASLDALDSLK